MRRIALSIIVVASILLTVAGSAATLGLASTDIGAGQAPVAPCGDTSAVTRRYTINAGEVDRIALAGFPATCEGGQAGVIITDGAGTAVANGGPAPISGGAVTLDLSPKPGPSQADAAHVVVSGPGP